jgi:hypothetical protein
MARARTLPMHICPECREEYRPTVATQVYCDAVCVTRAREKRGRVFTDEPLPSLRDEIEAAKRERRTAPLYRFWEHQT